MQTAILLVAHGSRRDEANDDLLKLAEMFTKATTDEIVEVGFLEIAHPSIPEGLQTCAERGAESISILPFFLSPGDHVTRDLANFRDRFLAQSPQIACHVCPPIGLHSKLVELMLLRLSEGRQLATEVAGETG